MSVSNEVQYKSNFRRKGMVSTRTINLEQCINTKINVLQHECNKHLYNALNNLENRLLPNSIDFYFII
jgi:hypothetical protein